MLSDDPANQPLGAPGRPDAMARTDGWGLRPNRPEDGVTPVPCATCGGTPAFIYHGHRLDRGQWQDVPAARLCAPCFTRRTQRRYAESR